MPPGTALLAGTAVRDIRPVRWLPSAWVRRARGAGGGVLVAAAEEGDQAPHEDAAQEDGAVGHQAPPHAVPAAAASPAGLDARRLQRHRRRGGPRPRARRGRLRR
jgi:hypothetical protein